MALKKQHTPKNNFSALLPPSHTALVQSRQLPSSTTPVSLLLPSSGCWQQGISVLPADGWCSPPANGIYGRRVPAAARLCTHTLPGKTKAPLG